MHMYLNKLHKLNKLFIHIFTAVDKNSLYFLKYRKKHILCVCMCVCMYVCVTVYLNTKYV